MRRHLTVIADSVPHTFHGGGGVTCYSAVRAMQQQGNTVSVIALNHSSYNGPKTEEEHVKHLSDLGVSVHILTSPNERVQTETKLKRYFPGMAEIFSGSYKTKEVQSILKKLQPDGLFLYHWDPIASSIETEGIPKLGIVGDPIHLPYLFRKSIYERYEGKESLSRKLKNAIHDKLRTRACLRGMSKLLESCQESGAFAAHHAEMFKSMGISNHSYFRTPTPDPLLQKPTVKPGSKFKILHIGHLRGTATLAGVELMATDIIPRLKASLPENSFEIHLVGGYFDTLPPDLKNRLTDPVVKVRGQISPSDEEFLSSHVVLVPTPIELGIRVRIITAFSFGSCIVAHSANQAGIPELEHERNCLLGNDGEALTRHCMTIFANPSKRLEYESASRQTYEKFFSLSVAGSAIADKLNKMVDRKLGAFQ